MSSAASSIEQLVSKVSEATLNAVKSAATAAVDKLNDWTSIDKQYDTELDIDLYIGQGAIAGVNTPWGAGAQFIDSNTTQGKASSPSSSLKII